MKRIAVPGSLLAFAVLSVIGLAAPGQAAPPVGSLPPSLDDHYPPKARGPMYLVAMLELARPLSGFVSDMQEGDMANAQANLEKFREEYVRISKLVPEWTSLYPSAPLDELTAAFKAGDQAKVIAALGAVDKACHGCHVQNMALAQQKYHWDDFTALSATDPLSKESVSFQMLMRMLDGDLTGIGNDLAQGQKEAALAHARGLTARFGALKETCDACHNTPRRYFVDEEITAQIKGLQAALESDPVDPKAVGGMLQNIGMESCHKCHLVHVPAAYAKQTTTAH